MGSLHAQVAKLTIIGHFGILQVVLNLQEREKERKREREECPFFLTLCPITTFFSLQKSGIYYGTF
jgi:hypothetical protein